MVFYQTLHRGGSEPAGDGRASRDKLRPFFPFSCICVYMYIYKKMYIHVYTHVCVCVYICKIGVYICICMIFLYIYHPWTFNRGGPEPAGDGGASRDRLRPVWLSHSHHRGKSTLGEGQLKWLLFG